MKYQKFDVRDKSEAERLLSSNDREAKVAAIVGMVNGIDDWEWVQEKLLSHIDEDDFWIAKNAISGLGDLARIHRSLDSSKVRRILKKIRKKELQGVVQSALEDMEIYLDV